MRFETPDLNEPKHILQQTNTEGLNFDMENIEDSNALARKFEMIEDEQRILESIEEKTPRSSGLKKALVGISLGVSLMVSTFAPQFTPEAQATDFPNQTSIEDVQKNAKGAFEELKNELGGIKKEKSDIWGELDQELQGMKKRTENVTPPKEVTPPQQENKELERQGSIEINSSVKNEKYSSRELYERSLKIIQEKIERIESRKDLERLQSPSLRLKAERAQEHHKKLLQEILKDPKKYIKSIDIEQGVIIFSGPGIEQVISIK